MAQVLLNLSEDSLEVDVIDGCVRLEGFINNVHCKDGNPDLLALEPLQ